MDYICKYCNRPFNDEFKKSKRRCIECFNKYMRTKYHNFKEHYKYLEAVNNLYQKRYSAGGI